MAQFNPIRPITQRLNTTPTEELPRYAGLLAASILSSAESLRSTGNKKNDASIQVHKLVTRVSSLLQDKTQEGRFTGIVLVKALAEAIEPQELAASASIWVRSLLSCLNKPDPVQVKKLAIVAITRIFLLTQGNQAMIRETTTPSLPAFMNACLHAIRPMTAPHEGIEKQVLSPLLQTVLQCWVRLIKRFPSTIRPFVSSIRTILLGLMGQRDTPENIKTLAQQVFAALHFSAPKDTGASEWIQSLRLVIESAHQASDLIFRSMIEEWTSSVPRQKLPSGGKRSNTEVCNNKSDPIGMDKWTGLQAGCSRAVELLHLLSTMLVSEHAQIVNLPLTEVLDLCGRFAAVPWPTKDYSLRENKEIPQQEREEVYVNLVRVHLAVLELHRSLAGTFGRALVPVSRQLLSQIWEIFEAEASNAQIRSFVYITMTKVLEQGAVSLIARDSGHMAALVHACCQDLYSNTSQKLSHLEESTVSNNLKNYSDRGQRQSHDEISERYTSSLSQAAKNLLPMMLTHVPNSLLTSSARTEIDRTAILIEHEAAMFSSIINPPVPRNGGQITPSILPFLARATKDLVGFESLIRPRMPILRNEEQTSVLKDSEEEDENELLSQEDVGAFNANLHAVTDHVAQQLEENVAADKVSDLQGLNKRDFAAVDGMIDSAATETSKRFKTDSPPLEVEYTQRKRHEDLTRNSEMKEYAVSSVLTEPDALKAGSTSRPFEESQSLAPSASVSMAASEPPNEHGQETDSDDSGIPQIDATLSSDSEVDSEDDL